MYLQPIASSTAAEPIAPPLALLVEPPLDLLAHRALLLAGSHYTVTTASSEADVWYLRCTHQFSFAVLSDRLGAAVLRAVAECIRSQWPRARILVLGNASAILDDPLYDETVEHHLRPEQLLFALQKLVRNERLQPGKHLRERPASVFYASFSSLERRARTSESDPRKVADRKSADSVDSRGAQPEAHRGAGRK